MLYMFFYWFPINLFHYAILSATIGTHILEQSWTSSEEDVCV